MKNKLLLWLLNSFRNKTIYGPCTREASSVVSCCDYLLRHLKEAGHE